MTKNDYREYFIRISPYVRWPGVCEALHINYSNFKKFKQGVDRYLAPKKCQMIVDFLSTHFDEVANDILKDGEQHEK